jgi:hypothetical protein
VSLQFEVLVMSRVDFVLNAFFEIEHLVKC